MGNQRITYSFDDGVDKFLGFVNLLFSVCHDKAVEIFFLVRGVGSIGTALSFLHRSFPTDSDLSTRFSLHFFEGVATRSNQESNY